MARRPSDGPVPSVVFTLDSKCEFQVLYLGTVAGMQRSPSEIIDYVDTARRLGSIAWRPSTEDMVFVFLTKHGLKVTDRNKNEVFVRASMHALASVFAFTDDGAQHVVVMETKAPNASDYKYYFYQCTSAQQAQEMCASFRAAFDVVAKHVASEKN